MRLGIAGNSSPARTYPWRGVKYTVGAVACDHFGVNAKIADPEVADEEVRTVTVKDVYWKDALPVYVTANLKSGDPTKADCRNLTPSEPSPIR